MNTLVKVEGAALHNTADAAGADNMAVLAQLISAAEQHLATNPLEALKSLDHAQALLLRGNSDAVIRGGLAPWQRRKVIQFVEENLTSLIRIGDLAGLVKLRESHFSRAFKATFNDSPYNYIIGRRLARARQLMLDTDEPLSFIALECGMSDQAHFCNTFRRFFGTTPNAWRRQHRVGARLCYLQ